MSKEEKNTAIYVGFEEIEPYDPSRPEKNLLRAVLITAMSDLRKGGDPARKAREFFLTHDDKYLFSFQSICNQLDLDPKLVLMVTGMFPKRRSAVEESEMVAAEASEPLKEDDAQALQEE